MNVEKRSKEKSNVRLRWMSRKHEEKSFSSHISDKFRSTHTPEPKLNAPKLDSRKKGEATTLLHKNFSGVDYDDFHSLFYDDFSSTIKLKWRRKRASSRKNVYEKRVWRNSWLTLSTAACTIRRIFFLFRNYITFSCDTMLWAGK